MGLVLFAAGVVYTVALAAVLVATSLLLLAAVAVVGASAVTVWRSAHHDGASDVERVDAIVVLGAAQYNGRPSPVLRARLDHAIVLYREGYAPMILVTGGVGRGDTTSEALAGQRYLVAHEVPQEAVGVQPVGRSTRTSMTAVGEWLGERGLRRVLLVSDPFHMFRLRLEARRTRLEAYTSPTESSPISANPVVELRYLFAEGLKVPIAWVRSIL